MAPKYALVLLKNKRKTSIIPEEFFEKSFKENGKEVPLCEGTVRVACILGKRYECKILRLCSTKKYLESLLVSKDGNILLHGSAPSCKENLAGKIKLYDDGTDEQKLEKRVMQSLNEAAEEQPPNIRLDGMRECNEGCSRCCLKQLPPFPSLPDGFVKTLVSLSEYFSHFHKSTAANILATGAALANLANHLSQPWQWPSEKKVELWKGAGVWIDANLLSRLVKLAEFGANRKPPHQALVKSLLTHLMGMEKYIETSAERIDRRLMSAVVAFTNEKYPEMSQPVERYFRCINLNRGYLIKKRNDHSNQSDKDPSHKETSRGQRRPLPVDMNNITDDPNPRKAKVFISGPGAQASVAPINNSEKKMPTAATSNILNKKILVLQRGNNPGNVTNLPPNTEQVFNSLLNTVPKSAPNSNSQPYVIKTSATVSNSQPYVIKTNTSGLNSQPYVIKTNTSSTSSQPYIFRTGVSSSNSQPFLIKTSTISSNSQPNLTKANFTNSNSQPYVIKTNTAGASFQSLLHSQNNQASNSTYTPQRVVLSSLASKPVMSANLQNTPPLGTDSSPIILSDTSKSFVNPARPQSVVCSVTSSPRSLSQGIKLSQFGSFRFTTPSAQVVSGQKSQAPVPIEVKIEKKCRIEGALEFDN